jgi:uncharacterized membrane protein YdbT with pleckstrin-like domain
MSFHISRWRYWWAYLFIILLALYAFWLTDRAQDAASWTAGIAAFILLIIMETVIRRQRVIINNSVEIRSGSKKTHIEFKNVSNVSVQQSVLQNLLRHGTVIIKLPGEEIVLSGFTEPNKIKRQIESKMHLAHQAHKNHVGL